jgi:hypothetical protein
VTRVQSKGLLLKGQDSGIANLIDLQGVRNEKNSIYLQIKLNFDAKLFLNGISLERNYFS